MAIPLFLRLATLSIVAACAGPGPSSSIRDVGLTQPTSGDPLESLADRLARVAIHDGQTAGVTVAVARRGTISFTKGYGLADVENGVPATADTVYRIGSLTKQFTAAAIMQLAEQHLLNLDDDVTRFVSAPTGGHVVTIRQLLNHTSGIPDYTELDDFLTWSRSERTPNAIIERIKVSPWRFIPGTKFEYSNTGYVVLGMVIEKVSGESYAAYLATHVFPKAGLVNTRYCDETALLPHRAHGYELTKTRLVNASPIDMSTPFSAGALCSTVSDLLRWSMALDAMKVVSATSFAQMTSPPTLADGTPSDYGFGLVIDRLEGHRTIAHNGGINGFVSELHDYPDDRVIIVVLTNTVSAAASSIEHDLAQVALAIPSKAIALPASERDAVVGVYDVPTLGRTEIQIERDQLTLAAPDQPHLALEYRGNDRFVIAGLATVTFHRNGGAIVGMTIEQGGMKLEATRLP